MLKKYNENDIDIDTVASLSKLRLSEEEKKGFVADMCDMANYTHKNLYHGSASDALVLSVGNKRKLSQLRDDTPVKFDGISNILENAPALSENMIVVPKTVDTGENR